MATDHGSLQFGHMGLNEVNIAYLRFLWYKGQWIQTIALQCLQHVNVFGIELHNTHANVLKYTFIKFMLELTCYNEFKQMPFLVILLCSVQLLIRNKSVFILSLISTNSLVRAPYSMKMLYPIWSNPYLSNSSVYPPKIKIKSQPKDIYKVTCPNESWI